jgi:Antitoxin ParD
MSRLTIEIDPNQHRQIKTLATFAGMTLKDFILAKTLSSSAESKVVPSDTTAKLLGSPENAKRLREAITSPTPEHLIFESIEDVQNALGIKARAFEA